MSTMATGMAFGAGSEIAHQGVRAMMGGGSGHGGQGQAPAEGGQGGYAEGGQGGYAQDYGEPQQQQMAQAQPQQHPCFDFS